MPTDLLGALPPPPMHSPAAAPVDNFDLNVKNLLPAL